MLRWRGVEASGGFLLLLAALYYFDRENLLPLALLACTVHELGHCLAIRLLGGRVALLRLTCVGAELRLSSRYPLGAGAELLAALAGPAASLLLALAAARLADRLGEGLYVLAGFSLVLGLFNLLPVAQLDGGRILRCLLALLGTEEQAGRLARVVSGTLAAGLLLGGVLLLGRGGNITLPVTAAWLLLGQGPAGERRGRSGGICREHTCSRSSSGLRCRRSEGRQSTP